MDYVTRHQLRKIFSDSITECFIENDNHPRITMARKWLKEFGNGEEILIKHQEKQIHSLKMTILQLRENQRVRNRMDNSSSSESGDAIQIDADADDAQATSSEDEKPLMKLREKQRARIKMGNSSSPESIDMVQIDSCADKARQAPSESSSEDGKPLMKRLKVMKQLSMENFFKSEESVERK